MPIDYRPTESKTEKEWQAQEDAHTLARAEAIKADQNRLTAAQVAAQKMLDDEKKDVQLLSKVAGRRVPANAQQEGSPRRSRTTGYNVFQKI